MSEHVEVDPEILSGAPFFKGTRVIVKAFFDYLENGQSIDEFLEDFPTVDRDQVTGLIEELRDKALAEAGPV